VKAGEVFTVAHLADSHLDERDELEDNFRVHDAAIEAIEEAGPEVILHAGDFHNRRSSPDVRQVGLEIIDRLAAIAPVVLVRGNHDVPRDLLVYAGRRGKYRVHVAEFAQTITIKRGLFVQCLPWVDKVFLATKVPIGEATATNTDERAKLAIRQILDFFAASADPAKGVTVGAGHVLVGGSVLSTGQTLIGAGVEVASGDLARTGAALWALGHIHKAQPFGESTACEVRYSGSLQRLNFGEPETKSITIWTLRRDASALGGAVVEDVQAVPMPARKIERLEVSLATAREFIERGVDGVPLDIDAARVRIRFEATPEELAALDREKLEKVLLAAGAVSVKIEPTITHAARVRSEGIAEERTEGRLLERFLEARGRELPDADLSRLYVKLGEIGGLDANK